jgi:hypothetical protein
LTHPISATTHNDDDVFSSYANRIPPCAFLGSSRSAVSGPTSIITGQEDFVQLSSEATGSDLDDRNIYSRFARTIPSDAGTTEALILFLYNELKIEYLAVLHINDSFGSAYASKIRDAALLYAPEMEILQIPMNHRPDYSIAPEELEQALRWLQRSEFLFSIVVLLDSSSHDAFMVEAQRMGLVGSGQHNFKFIDGFDINSLTNRVFEYGSELHLAYSGTGIIRAGGGILGESHFDKLTQKLQQIKQSTRDILYASSLLPGDPCPLLTHEKFFSPTVFDQTSYYFDATILLAWLLARQWGKTWCSLAKNCTISFLTHTLKASLAQSFWILPPNHELPTARISRYLTSWTSTLGTIGTLVTPVMSDRYDFSLPSRIYLKKVSGK